MTDEIFPPEVIKKFVKLAPETKPYIEKADMQLLPRDPSPFTQLVRAINFQQLSGKAASTIHGRFLDLIGELTPQNVLKYTEGELRAVGLSRQKASYVRNVADAFSGELAQYRTKEDLEELSSEQIVDLFSSIKGVGSWTVEMYLLFSLGRLDVLAVKDLAVRKGIQIIYKLDEVPKPKEAQKLAEHWQPYASVGTYLCYRILAMDQLPA